MKNKTLILFFCDDEKTDEMPIELNKYNFCDAKAVFVRKKKIFYIFRKIHLLFCIYGSYTFCLGIWLREWKKELLNYNQVICIASKYSPLILNWIHKKNKNIRLINYFWDEIEVSGYPVIKNNIFENWSFCKWNCEKYNIKYNPQFFLPIELSNIEDIEYDVSFVGSDRGGKWKKRGEYVQHWYIEFKNIGLKTYFWYLSSDNNILSEIRKNTFLSVDNYYSIISKSKAVIEIVEPDKSWQSLRPFLTLSNKKKLITNNRSIKNENYYSKENIFVLDVDNIENLSEFLNTPFDETIIPILDNYKADVWLNRFGIY